MNIGSAFPSKWLKCADLGGQSRRVTMDHVTMEDVGDGEPKPILWFRGSKKGLVLNKTNASVIGDIYGDETDHWTGHPIEVYPDRTSFQGKMVDCIRVRVPRDAAPAAPVPAPPPIADEDIPF